MRDRPPHTRQLHTPAGETPIDKQASGKAQPGRRAAGPDQERRGTEEAPGHTHHPRPRPRLGRLRPDPCPGTNCNPQPRKAGSEQRPYPQTHYQIRSPRPNTCAPNPNLNRHKTGATHSHPHQPQAPARTGRGQAETQTGLCGVERAVRPFSARGWVGFPPFAVVFLWGGFACSSLPSLGWRMHWSVNGVPNRLAGLLPHVAVLWVAVGRAPAPCALWLIYTHGLTARPVRSGCSSAGWPVAPARLVGSGVRGMREVAEALFWGGVARFPPAPVVWVRCWRV